MTARRTVRAVALELCAIVSLAGCDSSSSSGQEDEGDAGEHVEGIPDGPGGEDDVTDFGVGADADAAADEDVAVDFWGPLPAGCEHAFPADSVRCDVQICPEEWALCCGTHLCGDMSMFVQGCCNDETCGTGGEPMTYSCREAGRAWMVVADCNRWTGTPCPAERSFCCSAGPGPVFLCADHSLGRGWNCDR